MIPNKKEIKEIVNRTFYDLGYKKKYTKEYYTELVNTTFENIDWSSKSQDIETKCPKIITSLPHSLGTTDVNQLQERLDESQKRINDLSDTIQEEQEFREFAEDTRDEAIKERDEAQKNLDDYHKQEDDWIKADEKLQGEAIDESNDIRDGWKELTRTAPDGSEQGVDNFKRLDLLMGLFGVDEFEHKGVLYGEEADNLRGLADSIESYSLNSSDDATEWSQTGVDLADNIRSMADKYDVNKHPLGDDLNNLMSVARQGLPSQWQDTIDRNNEIIRRNDESIKDSLKIQKRAENNIKYLEQDAKKTRDKIRKQSN